MGAVVQHDAKSRPDFAAPIYAGFRSGTRVPEDAPPLFIVISDDDELIAPISSARLYEAWHEAGKPVELHVFGSGGHGFGMNRLGLLSDQWTDLFRNWMAALGFIEPTDR
jgi:acetyl esterase/lipase